MFSPKDGAIDGDIIYKDGMYHFFYKGNTKDENGKEIKNGIKQATSKLALGVYNLPARMNACRLMITPIHIQTGNLAHFAALIFEEMGAPLPCSGPAVLADVRMRCALTRGVDAAWQSWLHDCTHTHPTPDVSPPPAAA